MKYDTRQGGTEKNRLFSNGDLAKLFLPLILEQFLETMVGLADSVMVASVGEAAVSGVSLVDMIMALMISIFAALATGGTVVIGQYLGSGRTEKGREAASQLIWFTGGIGIAVMTLLYAFKGVILNVLFGSITKEVYSHANIYLLIVAASIPFLALYSGGAAIFRTTGNSRLPMKIMLWMNLLNVAGNALLVFGFGMGTAGIAIPTLVSRAGAAVLVLFFVYRGKNVLSLNKAPRYRFDKGLVKQIMGIGVPYGLENGMFYFGRLLILSLVSTFGTAAIAANSVGGTICSIQVLPGMAIGLGISVVISRCVGAGDYEQARYYTKKIFAIIYVTQLITAVVVLALFPSILRIYQLSAEASDWAVKIVWSHALVMVFIWPLGNSFPAVFRAAGDAKFSMVVSMITMTGGRIVLAYVLVYFFHMDLLAVWMAVYCDWLVKGVMFIWRYVSGRWTKFSVIK